jgi:hypothetical protein
MSEVETPYNPADNPWEPENAVVSSVLNGVTGKVVAAEFIRKQGKKNEKTGEEGSEYTVFRVVVTAEGLAKPRELLIGSGSLKPSKDGITEDVVGPFFVGKINKSSNFYTFVESLKAAGFPMQRFAKAGGDALIGSLITWKAIEKTFGRGKDAQTNTYDMPATFLGFEGEVAQQKVDDTELRATLTAAIQKAVSETGTLPRGQLAIKLAPVLKDVTNKAAALGLLVNDDFLAGIDGVAYDKKTFTAKV